MDISSFSDDNFDTKAWINNILHSDAQDKKENYTMSLVMKLQLYVQQVNNALEETSQHVLANLPKIMRDTKDLQDEALILKDKMMIVNKEIIKIEQDTGKSIDNIEKLDRAKTKLLDAKQGLHESDNWTVLVNDLEEAFDTKNIRTISAKILSMQTSLKLLINVSDYEERKLQLEGLKNRLEAIASTFIVQAFTSKLINESILYAQIFNEINRFEQLIKYYKNCQKDELLKQWRLQLDEDETSVIDWIHNYFDYLLSNWHTQFKWLALVFPSQSPAEVLIDVYVDVLGNLEPSVVECLDANLKQVGDKLGFLFEVKQIIKQFANNLLLVIDAGHLSNQGKRNNEKKLQLLQAIYNPLVNYVSKYGNYEKTHLTQKLSSIKCIKAELPETIQALAFSIPTVMDLARESKQRCTEITEHCGYCGLLQALRTFFISYADQYRLALRQIDRNKAKNEDWNSFQLCLSLMQNAGEVLSNLMEFERELTSAVVDSVRCVGVGGVEFKVLLLDAGERREFEALVKCVMEGTKLSLLDHVTNEFNKLCADIHYTTYQVVFAPISTQLDVIQNVKTWQLFSDSQHQSDLPDYSLTPQEYITQIGLYLMTLPQHLEPFLFRENPSLICALRAADSEYNNANDALEGAMAEVLLGVIAKGTCQGFCDRILTICALNNAASRQLAHDISYLGNVLEDLGLGLTENLQQLMTLLKLAPDQYQAQSVGCTARYVAAVRQMRNITSAG